MQNPLKALGLLIFLFLLASCGDSGPDYDPVAVEALPLEKANSFGPKLADALNSGNGDVLSKAFNVDAMLDISFADTSLFKDPQMEFRKELKSSLKPGPRSVEIVKAGGNYKFIRAYEDEEKNSHVILRVSSASGLEDYQDYRLAKLRGEENSIIIVDQFSYRTNQWLSENYRDIVVALGRIAGDKEGDVSKYAESLAQIDKIADLARKSQFPQILKEYEKLHPEVQKLKTVMLYRLIGSMFVSDEAFESAVSDFAELYPKDKAIGFNLMSIFVEQQAYKEVLGILDRLEQDLGMEDAYIAAARANMKFKFGELDEAVAAAQRAKQLEPDYEAAHWILLSVHVKMGNYSEAAEDLKILNYEFNVDPKSISEGEEFAEFVDSKPYRDLVAGQ